MLRILLINSDKPEPIQFFQKIRKQMILSIYLSLRDRAMPLFIHIGQIMYTSLMM